MSYALLHFQNEKIRLSRPMRAKLSKYAVAVASSSHGHNGSGLAHKGAGNYQCINSERSHVEQSRILQRVPKYRWIFCFSRRAVTRNPIFD
jgi:hypothetical protein